MDDSTRSLVVAGTTAPPLNRYRVWQELICLKKLVCAAFTHTALAGRFCEKPLLIWPGKVSLWSHAGERRHPVLTWTYPLDPGLREGDALP